MSIVSIAALCLTATIFCKLLDKLGREYAIAVSVLATAVTIMLIIKRISPVILLIENLFDMSGVSQSYAQILFKGLGICYITQLACDICKDNGESAMSSAIELFGKISVLITALPLFNSISDIIKELLK